MAAGGDYVPPVELGLAVACDLLAKHREGLSPDRAPSPAPDRPLQLPVRSSKGAPRKPGEDEVTESEAFSPCLSRAEQTMGRTNRGDRTPAASKAPGELRRRKSPKDKPKEDAEAEVPKEERKRIMRNPTEADLTEKEKKVDRKETRNMDPDEVARLNEESAMIRRQYEQRVQAEAAVGVPAALLSGFAVNILDRLQVDQYEAGAGQQALAVCYTVGLCLGLVTIFNLATVLVSSLYYWAGMRTFTKTTASDRDMIASFEKFWHDNYIKKVRANSRTLYMISPFFYVVAISVDLFFRVHWTLGASMALVSVTCMWVIAKASARVSRMVGHKFFTW